MEALRNYIINNKLTLLHPDKLTNFYYAIIEIKKIGLEGVSAELGAFKGGSSLFIAQLLKRTHYVFDTFEGIQNSGKLDSLENGAFSNVDEKSVRELLKDTESVIVKGLFTGNRKDELFCLSHFDGDTYQSCKDFLNYFYRNTVKNGYLFFDDYDFENAIGVKIAIDEFLLENKSHQKAFVSANHQFCIIK